MKKLMVLIFLALCCACTPDKDCEFLELEKVNRSDRFRQYPHFSRDSIELFENTVDKLK